MSLPLPPQAPRITARSNSLLPTFPTPQSREHRPGTGRTTELHKHDRESGAQERIPGGKGPGAGLRNLQQSHEVTALGSNSEPDLPPTFVLKESRH